MSGSSKKWSVLLAVALATLSARYASAQLALYGPTVYVNGGTGGYTGSSSSVATGNFNSAAGLGTAIGNGSYYFSSASSTLANDRYTAGYILTPGGTVQLATLSGASTAAGATPNVAKSINTSGALIAGLSNSYTYVNSGNTTVSNSAIAAVWNTAGASFSLPVAVSDPYGDGPAISSTVINNGGIVVGFGTVYRSDGASSLGTGAFVWQNSGTATSPTYNSYSELLAPGNSTGSISTGSRNETVFGIGDSGLAVGSGSNYNGSVSAGNVAVTWDTTSTPVTTAGVTQTTIAAVQLVSPTLPTDGSLPFGTVTGSAGTGTYTYSSGSGTGSGTVAAVTTGSQATYVSVVKSANIIAGSTSVYNTGTVNTSTGRYGSNGTEPVIWNGAGSTGAFLPLAANYTTGGVTGMNVHGDVIGQMQGTGTLAQQAVLWKFGTSAPTLLSVPTGTNPRTAAAYLTFTNVRGVNDYDYSVGYVGSSSGDTTGTNAMLWDSNGNATDLNTLVGAEVTPGGTVAGWVALLAADSISNSGAISGLGLYYDPNATNYTSPAITNPPVNGTAGEYYRQFLIQDSAAPEPGSLAAIGLVSGVGMMRRRSRRRRYH